MLTCHLHHLSSITPLHPQSPSFYSHSVVRVAKGHLCYARLLLNSSCSLSQPFSLPWRHSSPTLSCSIWYKKGLATQVIETSHLPATNIFWKLLLATSLFAAAAALYHTIKRPAPGISLTYLAEVVVYRLPAFLRRFLLLCIHFSPTVPIQCLHLSLVQVELTDEDDCISEIDGFTSYTITGQEPGNRYTMCTCTKIYIACILTHTFMPHCRTIHFQQRLVLPSP